MFTMSAYMTLQNKDPVLDDICRHVEKQLKDVNELVDIALAVDIVRLDDCAQCLCNKLILIDLKKIACYSRDEQCAIVAHEIAHAYLNGSDSSIKNEFKRKYLVDEEYAADYMVCRWGLADRLCDVRRKDTKRNPEAYCAALRCCDKEEYGQAIMGWLST